MDLTGLNIELSNAVKRMIETRKPSRQHVMQDLCYKHCLFAFWYLKLTILFWAT